MCVCVVVLLSGVLSGVLVVVFWSGALSSNDFDRLQVDSLTTNVNNRHELAPSGGGGGCCCWVLF